MTRRNFFAAKLAALFPPALSTGQPEGGSQSALPRARWIENGIIDAGGSHEPYTFVARRGGQPLDAYDRYQQAQSEQVIRRLKEQGVEVFHTHFYKGAGMAHEKAEMEEVRRVAEVAHRYGLRVDTYLQWNTMLYETFFAEEPRAQNWVQRDGSGKPVMLTYGYQQSFRYRPCFANPEYLDYLEKLVRYAVVEVKTDFIHFDNYDLNPEPDSCHCEHCVRGFRNFLRKKYSAAKRKERFGFENVDYVNPPGWNAANPPQRLEIIFDPVIQEWIDFRCQVMADALERMARVAKSINPEVVIEVNPHGITGGNRAWQAGLDHARFLKYTEVFWTEEHNQPAWLPDGRLLSKIRSYKLARAFRNVLFTYTANRANAIAECLAFNQTIGFAGSDPLTPQMARYIAFYRANRKLYLGAADAGNVAVLRSYASIAYHNAQAQLSAVLVEQSLIQAKIPFDLIFDEHLADLSKYRVVILPDSQCLSDKQLDALRAFVHNGGGLIATGLAGRYDEWRRLRVTPGLRGMVDSQREAKGYQEQVVRDEAVAAAARKEYGQGRTVYFAETPFDGELPEMGDYFTVGPRFWKAPRNWREVAEAVRWASRENIPLEVNGPPALVANLTSQPDQRRLLVHLVNYDDNTPSLDSIEIACHLPEGAQLKDLTIYSPDLEGPLKLKAPPGKLGATFTVPSVKVYAVAVLSYEMR